MFPQIMSVLYRVPSFHKPPPHRELAENTDYPNLNVADMNSRPENLSPRLHDCWDSITKNEQQKFALATNRREGNQWWGMFFGYSQLDHMTIDNADYKLQCECMVNKLCYASDSLLLVALSDTRLQAWSTYSTVRNEQYPYCLFMIGEVSAHNSPICHLRILKQKQAVSICLDNAINVWDLSGADLCSVFHARATHKDKLTGLAINHSSATQFLTCDRSGCALIWDTRTSTLASTCIFDDETNMLSFTCASWTAPTELYGDNYVYLGDFNGTVHTLDIRMTNTMVESIPYFEEGHVSQLLINGNYLAAMSNLPASVKIEKIDGQRQFVYSIKDQHTRITDALWRDDHTLLTIGYGRKLATHKIE